jgi:hypothetical protein
VIIFDRVFPSLVHHDKVLTIWSGEKTCMYLYPRQAVNIPILFLHITNPPTNLSHNMRAVVYDKPYSVSIHEVEKPKLTHPDDIIVKGNLLS